MSSVKGREGPKRPWVYLNTRTAKERKQWVTLPPMSGQWEVIILHTES